MSTNSVTGSTGTTSTASTTSSSTQQMQNQFLQMLVAQMKNQDPLNPLDNAQVTSQMAQLSTVTGINNLNDTLNSMSSTVTAAQSLQAASLVGHQVLVPGDKLALSGGSATGSIDLSGAADKMVVTVKDSAGNVVDTTDLGPQKTGVVQFQWDGTTDSGAKAPDGTYTYTVTATQAGNAVTATTLSVGQVLSVSLGSSGATLNINGLDPATMSQVRQIL